MNDEIISKNRLAYKFFFAGVASFIIGLFTGQIILILAFFICSAVWFFMQNSSRYCDYCGNYLQYVRQQIEIYENIACKTCDKKYRNGKIRASDTMYSDRLKKHGYGMSTDEIIQDNKKSLSVSYPDREPNEPDATYKQIAYIKKLTENIDESVLVELGKYQASHLIDLIINEKAKLTDELIDKYIE
jgi:DNA-directed RNA polymerase subunit M/transcription elongation factor TFIIS